MLFSTYHLAPLLYFLLLFFLFSSFFFNDTPTTEIYTLSLHDALPISGRFAACVNQAPLKRRTSHPWLRPYDMAAARDDRSEEHTSELQSRPHLVCRLLLEKKKKNKKNTHQTKKSIYKNTKTNHTKTNI